MRTRIFASEIYWPLSKSGNHMLVFLQLGCKRLNFVPKYRYLIVTRFYFCFFVVTIKCFFSWTLKWQRFINCLKFCINIYLIWQINEHFLFRSMLLKIQTREKIGVWCIWKATQSFLVILSNLTSVFSNLLSWFTKES